MFLVCCGFTVEQTSIHKIERWSSEVVEAILKNIGEAFYRSKRYTNFVVFEREVCSESLSCFSSALLYQYIKIRNAGTKVGQGGRSLEKGASADMTSQFKGSGGFKDCGAWDRNCLQGQRRVFFKLFSVEVVMHHVCALRFPLQTVQGCCKKTFYMWRVSLHLPESA